MTFGEWAFDRSMVTTPVEPKFVLVLVPQSIAVLPNPRGVPFDVTSRFVPFDAPPVNAG
jgi:hypothetical protein